MTKQQKENLYYLTQYAGDMTDKQLFDTIDNQAACYDLDIDLFVEIAETMTATPDAINERLFDLMLKAENNADLEITIMILTAIDNEDINELDKLTNYGLERMLNENNIHDEFYFTELADMELKEYGIYASCLSWVNNILNNFEFAELDCYDNFTAMTTAEVIQKFFDEYF